MENELELDLEQLDKLNIPTSAELDVQPEAEVSTDTPQEPEQVQQPSTEGEQETKIPTRTYDDPSLGGILKGTAIGLAEDVAPIVGISDTVIDTINFAVPGNRLDIPF